MKIHIMMATIVQQLQQLHQLYLYNQQVIMKLFLVSDMTINQLLLFHYNQLVLTQIMTEKKKIRKKIY